MSCNKEEDDGLDFSSDLIGEWIFVHDEGYVREHSDEYEYWDTDEFDENVDAAKMIFEEDGRWIIKIQMDGQWKTGLVGSWTYSEKELAWRYTDEEDELTIDTWTIKKLTSSELILECHETGDDNYDYYEKVTFKRE
ncbi:MAG: hypothetical protein AB2L20_12480 [Mangrovibacterium sp.]